MNQDTIRKESEPFVVIPKDILEQTKDKSAFMLYYVLKWHTNSATGDTFPSYSRIQQMTSMSRVTISKALNHLVEVGLIELKKDSVRKSNDYVIKWTSTENVLVQKMDSPSTENVLPLVQKMDSNKKNITKINKENNIVQGKGELIGSSESQVEWLKNGIIKIKDYETKYSRDELNEFVSFWTTPCDVTGATPLGNALKKGRTFSIGRTLANAKSQGRLKSSSKSSALDVPISQLDPSQLTARDLKGFSFGVQDNITKMAQAQQPELSFEDYYKMNNKESTNATK